MDLKQAQQKADDISDVYLDTAGEFISRVKEIKQKGFNKLYHEIISNEAIWSVWLRMENDIDMLHSERKHLFANDTLEPYLEYCQRMKKEIDLIQNAIHLVDTFVATETQSVGIVGWCRKIPGLSRTSKGEETIISIVIKIVIIVSLIGLVAYMFGR